MSGINYDSYANFSTDLKKGGIDDQPVTLPLKVVFCPGCFDLLGPHHVHFLNEAKKLGDKLVVGLAADWVIRYAKGESRPIQPFEDRQLMLQNLRCVDDVVEIRSETPKDFIQNHQPAVVVKGADWAKKDINEIKAVREYGGIVVFLPLFRGSTTETIRKIKGDS